MTTINTMQDLTRLLRENPEWRDEVRRELLTDELLQLPQRFAEYTEASERRFEAIDRRFEEIDRRFEEIDRRFEAVEQELRELREQVAQFVESTNRRFEAIESTLRVHSNDIGELKGIGLESRLYNRGISQITTLLKVRNSRRVRVAEADDNSAEFNSAIYEAEEKGTLSEQEYLRLLDTDMIVRSARRDSSRPVYVPIEASYTISRDDIDKVKRTADAIGKVFPSAEVCPVLYYMNISDHFIQVAEYESIGLIQVERLSA